MKERSLLIVVLACAFLFACSSAHAQQANLPLNRELMLNADRSMSRIFRPDTSSTEPPSISIDGTGSTCHSSFKPLIESHSFSLQKVCGYKGLNWDHNVCFRDLLSSEDIGFYNILKKKYYENLIVITDTTSKFRMTIDPLYNFEFGKDIKDTLNEKIYTNTRGALVRGEIGSQFSFETSVYENQSIFPSYIDTFNKTFSVVPGQGRWKPFKSNGYDYAMASGYISYSPSRHFNFQAGHGKHFIGDGYRSLLLSDNAFNYPFIRITSTFGKFQYTNMYSVFMNMSSGSTPIGTERLFQKKAASFQYLSWNIHKRVQLGLFEGLIWEAADKKNRHDIDISYMDPVIFGSAVQFGLNNEHNVLLGSTLKVKLSSSISFYGQYMLDESGSGNALHNKSGFQAGMKYYDMFGIKNLHAQLEYNQVRPYAYSATLTAQNYSHYNQPLAHPLGANFTETIGIIDYRYRGLFAQFKMNYAVVGGDFGGRNMGSNIFKSDSTAYFGIHSANNILRQGISTKIIREDIQVGYVINPATNMNIMLGFSNRYTSNNLVKSETQYIYVAFRTSLTNLYYDF